MLDDHAGGRLEGADALPSGIAVGNVVVGKLLALKLLIAGKKTRSNRCFAIEGGSLMGIFPVAHVLNFFPLAGKNLREASALIVFIKTREIVRDHAVVAGSMSEDLLGERKARGSRDGAFCLDFSSHGRVVGRIDDHGNGLVILGRSADHRRTANVDIFDRILKRAVGLGDRLLERIKIHADDIDRINAVCLKRSHVFSNRAACQNAGVNLGV